MNDAGERIFHHNKDDGLVTHLEIRKEAKFLNEKYNALFTPWKVGNVEIRNRIVQCSMGGTSLFGWLEPNHFDKEAAYFLLNRAQDGVGLILPGMQCVRDTMGIPGRHWLYQNDIMSFWYSQ